MAEPQILQPQLQLSCERLDGESALLRLEGELELFTEWQFRGQVDELIESGIRRVVVDLSELSFVDSAGISAMIWLRKRFPAPGAVSLVDPAARHVAALEAIQLTRIVSVYPTVEIALAESR